MIVKLTNEDIKTKRLSIEESKKINRFPIYVLLENIRSLYNVGSIFRTSDGARISELILTGYTPHPPRKELLKTSLGSTETVPWSYYENPLEVIKNFKKNKIIILAVELTNKSIPYYEIKKSDFPICLIFGNEISGISKELLEYVDGSIEIPMFGFKHSLNVSVCAGIVIFDLIRKINQKE